MGSYITGGGSGSSGDVSFELPLALPTGGTLKFASNATGSASDQVLFTTTAGKTAYVIRLTTTRASTGDLQPVIFKNHAATEIFRMYSALGNPNFLDLNGAIICQVAASETLIINNANQTAAVLCVYYEV